MRTRLTILFAAAALTLPTPTTGATDDGVVEFMHKGVQIAGKPAPDGKYFDIDIVEPAAGAETVKKALDILYEGSAYNAKAIEKLKAAGNVVIVYDPAFPKRELTKVTIAAFLPDFYQAEGRTKDFLTVVGRFGGKWSPRELAPVLAHELTGHGMQHLRGRLENVREVDLECEAYLYQEKAYQDLGFDKGVREMVQFRKTLEGHWCADFKAWQRKNSRAALKSWDKLHPDVPAILDDYLVYIDALRKSGVAGSAVAKAKQQQARMARQRLAKLSESSDPKDQFQLGLIYARGIGVDANPAAARTWFEKAAEAGHGPAQYELSRIYWRGDGVATDKAIAAQWAKASAENGVPEAAYIYGAMLINGDGIARDRAEGTAWMVKAADAGIDRAADVLKQLGVNR
ncbi:MAG: tetratricopeptide repeat protein [Rhodospirillales bacterium]